MQMGKRRDPKQLTTDKINANIGLTADSTVPWWPENGIPCLNSARDLLTCSLIILAIAKVSYDSLTGGNISEPVVIKDTPVPSPTSPSTVTPTGCPPRLECPDSVPMTSPPLTTPPSQMPSMGPIKGINPSSIKRQLWIPN